MIRSGWTSTLIATLTCMGADAVVCAQSAQNSQRTWTPFAVVDSAAVGEFSGVVASRKYSGVFWTHGDSGNEPALVAFDLSGKVLAEIRVSGAPNTDWEDIAADDKGNLYIGDIGNNHGMFPARYVYRVTEPDPFNPPADSISITHRWRFKYPDKKRFDCESLFWHDGSLHVIAKVRPVEANIYRLDETKDGEAKLKLLDAPGLAFPTGADTSADGKHLVVCSYSAAWMFDLTEDVDHHVAFSNRRLVRYPMGEGAIESVTFVGDDVVMMAENGKLYRLTPKDFDQQVRFVRPGK